MEQLIIFLQFILSLIGDFFGALVDAFTKQTGFNAEFGKERLIASRFNRGLVISKHRKLTRKASFSNMLLSAVTGSGKSTRIIIKCLFSLKKCTIIVNDPSKELFLLTSGYLSKFFTVRTLNFSNSSISSGYNILSRIKKPNDINKVAHVLVAASLDKGNSSDPFWSLSVKTLLQILIRLTLAQDEQYRNMANVMYLLHRFAADPALVDRLIAQTNDAQLNLEYKSLLATPEKTLQNIVASAKAALQLFDDPEIAKTTAYDTIDFNQLRKEPTVIFLHNTIGDTKYLSVLISLFFEQLYNHVLEQLPAKKDLDLFCILDEASSLLIPLLPLACANGRKVRLSNLISVQSKSQLKSFYKDEAENITANCVTKLYLPGQTSIDELKEIEMLSGKCVYTDKKTGAERVKPLVTIDEIRLLPKYRSLIISGNHPIIKGRTSPYYRSIKYSRFAKIAPVDLRGDIPTTPVPLLQ